MMIDSDWYFLNRSAHGDGDELGLSIIWNGGCKACTVGFEVGYDMIIQRMQLFFVLPMSEKVLLFALELLRRTNHISSSHNVITEKPSHLYHDW